VGYYSKFSLRVEPVELYDQVARDLTKWEGVFAGQEHKWYSHEADCRKLSSTVPDITIKVQRLGEDDGDRFRYVYKNGEQIECVKLRDHSHIDDQGNYVDLLFVDDDYLRNIVQWALRKFRTASRARKREPVTASIRAMAFGQVFRDAVDECAWRGILPTVYDLHVAWDRACARGHVDTHTSEPLTVYHPCEGPVRDGDERPVWVEQGPRDLVELWVGYGDR
jgi:hypothetical protein